MTMPAIKTKKNISKKAVITEKASELFKQKGYNATSMRHLAEAVGVEAASLYNHIDSKASILHEICFRVADAFNENLDEVEKSSQNALTKIERILRFHIRMMIDRYDEIYVANHDWKHLEEPGLTEFLNHRRNYEKRMAAIIEAGVKKNELRSIEPHVAVLVLLSAVRGIEFWQRNKRNISAAELEENMILHLTGGLKKQ